jgi:hypothetical protein
MALHCFDISKSPEDVGSYDIRHFKIWQRYDFPLAAGTLFVFKRECSQIYNNQPQESRNRTRNVVAATFIDLRKR